MWCGRSSLEHPKINKNVEWSSGCLLEKGIRASSSTLLPTRRVSILFRQLAGPTFHPLLRSPPGTPIQAAHLPSNNTEVTEISQGLPRRWQLALSDR